MFVNLFKVAIYHDVSLAAWIFFRPVDVCDLGPKGNGEAPQAWKSKKRQLIVNSLAVRIWVFFGCTALKIAMCS